MNPLAQQHCAPVDGQAAYTAEQIAAHLTLVPGWVLVDGAIEREFSFSDYHHTLAFVNALAWIAHTEDHHPALLVTYNRCKVRFNTHSVNGLSLNDFICAARVDGLLP